MTETSSTSSTGAKEQAQQAAGTAADEGRHVAGVAADEARTVAGEARDHARGLLDDATSQLDAQTRTQRDRAASTLATFADDLDQMAEGVDDGLAGDLARRAATRARTLGQHLDGREPRDLLDDVRGFARRRPGLFLAGSLTAGVVVGRLLRGARDAGSTSSTGSGSQGATSATGQPLGQPVAQPGTQPGTPPTGGPSSPPPAPDPVPVTSPVTPATTSVDDPLGLDDPAAGSAVPPSTPGRYEP